MGPFPQYGRSTIRDIKICPPKDWSLQRRRDYLTWSGHVVVRCRGVNPVLDYILDAAIHRAQEALDNLS
jgi:hypothetical protein